MTLAQFTVARRLHVGFGLVLTILLVVSLLAVAKVGRIDAALAANHQVHGPIQRHAINFRGSAHDRSIAVRDVVLAANPADRDKEKAAITRLARFYADSAGPLAALVQAPGAAPELARLHADIQAIETRTVGITQQIIELVEREQRDEAQVLLWTQAKPAYEQWLAAVNRLIDFEETRIQAGTQRAIGEAGSFLTVMLTALGVALALGITLAWAIPRSIQRQLGAEPALLKAASRRVAEGDLSPVPGANQAPAGSVLASLGGMQQALAGLVGQVREASDAIAEGSAQIAGGNADLSRRTELQAGSLQQTAASMQALSGTVQANAETALEANRMAGTASTAAEQGGTLVGKVVTTMHDISESSRRIADIIGVIDGIAFQTNILALNAAVEAARAGEQGRGFAVVAGEVRSLAQRSADAAKEIKSLIGTSMDRVENGTRLVSDAGQAMDGIVGQVRQVSALIERISEATLAQQAGIGEVGQAVTRLDSATQQNAALVEQSAHASENLRRQATQLSDTVSVFKLGDQRQTV